VARPRRPAGGARVHIAGIEIALHKGAKIAQNQASGLALPARPQPAGRRRIRERIRMSTASQRARGIALALGIAAIATVPGRADDFYKGKTINLYIGSGAGGGYDLFGRLVARHLGRFVPGQPAVVPRNMPGAGSLNAANFVYNNAPRDGTVLEIGTPSIAFVEAIGSAGIRFESARLNWIGRVASLLNVTVTWHRSPVKSIADAVGTEAVIASIAEASPLTLYPRALNSTIGTRFRVITGYADSNATLLAVERGEADGATASWATLNATRPHWLKDKLANVLVQYATYRHPQMPDVPAAVELARTDEERGLLSLIVNGAEVGYSIMSTPDTPADRIAMLRAGFDAMLTDQQFLADIRMAGAEFDPMSGEKLQALIRATLALPAALREKARLAVGGK
jgi:tripartite-type tricarboxylate transporter receptor subunit TctC